MTKQEAKQQLETFFRQLGIEISFFEDKNFVRANVGEAVLGFEFIESDGRLDAQALIYRFRRLPSAEILEAIFAEEKNADTGGGTIRFDEDNLSLFLEKKIVGKIADEKFYEQINRLARASLLWSSRVLQNAAEKVHRK